MKDAQGYEVCARCQKRLDLSDEVHCAECAEVVERETNKWSGSSTWDTSSQVS